MEKIGIIMNGVTGRMGTNQHLDRSTVSSRGGGGVRLRNGSIVQPEPVLVRRNPDKLQALARRFEIERWSTDLDECLSDPGNRIYFDAQATNLRKASVQAAIAAGKHVYCEKPLTPTFEEAVELASAAADAGVKCGIVQDKLFLPGLIKLKQVIQSEFLGRILSVRGEFGYWVFEGDLQPAQRPSWNYRSEDGGGIIADMFCHWRYVLDHTFGEVTAVQCTGATHIPERVDEKGIRYKATADDAAYGTFRLAGAEGEIIAQFNSSWAVRVYRDELLSIQVDGTEGSAVAGLRGCKTQHRVNTPRPTWNPDIENPFDFFADWQDVPDNGEFDNAFKYQWEMFLRHVAIGTPYIYDFYEGAKGVQLAELGLKSWAEQRWLDVPALPRVGALQPA